MLLPTVPLKVPHDIESHFIRRQRAWGSHLKKETFVQGKFAYKHEVWFQKTPSYTPKVDEFPYHRPASKTGVASKVQQTPGRQPSVSSRWGSQQKAGRFSGATNLYYRDTLHISPDYPCRHTYS